GAGRRLLLLQGGRPLRVLRHHLLDVRQELLEALDRRRTRDEANATAVDDRRRHRRPPLLWRRLLLDRPAAVGRPQRPRLSRHARSRARPAWPVAALSLAERMLQRLHEHAVQGGWRLAARRADLEAG